MVDVGGVGQWDAPPFLLDNPWVNGEFLDSKTEPFTKDPALGVNLLLSKAGTAILQKPYRGAKAPDAWNRVVFTFQMMADYRDDFLRFRRAAAIGSPFWFTPGGRETDIFQAVTSSTYTLTRPLASSQVTGVTEVTHPTVVLLDGVVDAAAATVVTQTVTALKTGQIEVQYTPVYWVAVMEAEEAVDQHNSMPFSVVLEELLQGSFA